MSDYNYYSYNNKSPKNKGFGSYVIVALLSALIGGIISSYIAPTYLYGKLLPMPQIYNNMESTVIPNQINITPSDNISAVTAVSRKSISSVVGITTLQVQRDLFFLEREVEGVGSGVVVDPNGYILTNSHVIGDGKVKRINVLFENGDKLEGRVLWNDSILDLAIVKVEARGLPVADLGDSDKIEVGELAVAIGNPLGLDFQRTVTSGIISGLHRSIQVEAGVMEDLIQTDASINPGNSGGPLLNSNGDVIGINTAKIRTGEGIGFAIPINIVKPIVSQVIKEGTFDNVYIGFKGTEVERYERELNVDLNTDKGVVIIEILPNSPAQNANLQPIDIIKQIDDQSIETMAQLRKTLYKYKVGDKATLTINRNGEQIKVEITFFNF